MANFSTTTRTPDPVGQAPWLQGSRMAPSEGAGSLPVLHVPEHDWSAVHRRNWPGKKLGVREPYEETPLSWKEVSLLLRAAE